MSTMTLPLPTPARGATDLSATMPSARADKPAKAQDSNATRDAKRADTPEDTRFGHALKQARDDEPQASSTDAPTQPVPAATTEAASTTPEALAIDPTLASLWMGTALPQATTEAAQTTALVQDQATADGTEPGADAQPLPHLQMADATVNPVALPLGLAMTATTPLRPAQAPTTDAPDAQPQGTDTRSASAPPRSPSSDTALASMAAKAAATPGTNTAAPITEQRPAPSIATLQAQPSWAAIVADTTQAQPAASGATLNLPATTPTQWREPLLNALGERVQWQLQRGQEQAVIRLEPPNLGRVEIHIRQEAGGLQVHLNATHRDVVQQLQGVSDQLRSELSLRHAGDVAVAVADQSRDTDARQRGRGQGGEQQQDPGRALSEGESTQQQRSAFTLAGSNVEKA